MPGIIPGKYYAVTAASGVGKTKITKEMFVNTAYKYYKDNPEVKLKILYFALEESKEKFWATIKGDLLREKFGTSITYYQLTGHHEGLTKVIEDQLKQIEPEIQEMKKVIDVIDYVSNPTGIKKYVEEVMSKLGKKETTTIVKDEYGNEITDFTYTYYDPNTIVIGVLDHISLVSTEKNKFADCSTLMGAMTKISETVMKIFTRKYRIAWINIHQQEMAGENVDNAKLKTLMPSQSKLGDNKMIGRDYEYLIGLFNPSKYEMYKDKSYNGYDLSELGKNFREMSIIKHRDGEGDERIPLYFHGKSNYFYEMPLPKDEQF
jgi:hypothetical protein